MDRVVEFSRLLADPSRRAIFERLARAAMTERALAGALGLPRHAVAHHLHALKVAGLVSGKRESFYRVDCAAVARLRRHLDAAWSRSVARAFLAQAMSSC